MSESAFEMVAANRYRAMIGMDVVHEQVDGVCVGCEEAGGPVEWLLAEARGHSDEVG